jgi:hypothetical protein
MENPGIDGDEVSQFTSVTHFEVTICSDGHEYRLFERAKTDASSDKISFAGISCGDVRLESLDTFHWKPSGESFHIIFFVLQNHNDVSALVLEGDQGGNFPTITIFKLNHLISQRCCETSKNWSFFGVPINTQSKELLTKMTLKWQLWQIAVRKLERNGRNQPSLLLASQTVM